MADFLAGVVVVAVGVVVVLVPASSFVAVVAVVVDGVVGVRQCCDLMLITFQLC